MADVCQVGSERLYNCSREMAVVIRRPRFVSSVEMSVLELGCVHARDCVKLRTR